MHTRISKLLILTLLMGCSAVFAQTIDSPKTNTATSAASGQPLKTSLLPPMQEMAQKLKTVKITGDPDADYITLAKIHTQGTHDLLKAVLEVQSDSALTQAAKTMLSTAETDLASLNTIQKELKPGRANAAFAKQQRRVVAAIQEKIKQSASSYKLTDQPGKNLAIVLKDQRQDAANLATSYLQFGKETELRNFAQQSIEKVKLDLGIIENLFK
ncbi:DUF305 domain-containing protein [Spirosoma oryzicola]|uniref:DUF305 domain-containing protein n=1 Tax=Spirosoma oryzicola TaxID=2898794 RepID=UPI001E3554BD|nr:DUF305 domain-containing protein [Spirosoma oryzicola]UHG93547.1 DUF305 domain-containing protein [Spirosoma oryzicola]